MIKLKNVHFRHSDRMILSQMHLQVLPGECMALLGPSGCGKTTTLRLVAGLESPTKGEIWIDGILASTPRRQLPPHRRGLGMVFQDLALWPHMTVRQHLVFAGGRRSSRVKYLLIEYLLEKVGLTDLEKSYPHQLSGGEKQRLALARALAQQPRILLLDEPLTGLDSRLRRRLLIDMRHLISESGVTTIYVTHRWREAVYIADRVAVMDGGRIGRVEFSDYFSPEDPAMVKPVGRMQPDNKVIRMDFRKVR